MGQILIKYRYVVFMIFTVFLFQSCKTDEFKIGEIKIKEDWGIKIITPLFTGQGMEFRDFVHDWKKPVPNLPGDITVLDYSNAPDETIPTQLIFDHSAIIDSFPFYIQGAYRLTEIELEFTVTNGCPFPLNLQLQFYNKSSPNQLGSPVVPKAFPEGDFTHSPEKPLTSVQSFKLDSLQILSFMNGDRVKFTSWYNTTDYINQNDTISAHYPIDVSIVLIGIAQGEK